MKKLNCILLITILFVSCKIIDNEAIKKEQTTVLFELIKGGCYGTCPIYSISVDENRQIKYEGKRFVDAIGTYNWIMNEKDFNTLKALIDKKFKADYTHNMEVQDLPLTRLNIKNKHHVKFKGSCPIEFKKELKQIEMLLLKNSNWKKRL
tara:strand:- start:10 stop:459 length:450 start_codon:yes stop_codon:yes gene_type:complete